MCENHLTIAFAESASAGRAAFEFSLTADSGSVLKGGLVCYDACIKEDILGVDPALIEKFTPESSEITKAVACRLSHFMDADIHVAITGLPSPGGSENRNKPVGTMFIHILMKDRSVALRKVFHGTPESIILQTIDLVAQAILDALMQTS